MRIDGIAKVLLGTFVRPAEETGTGRPRVEAVYGYLLRHDHGLVLLDTGLGEGDAETEAWDRPQRIPLQQALHGRGASLDQVEVVAPPWMTRLLEFDPKRVVFAHDAPVWAPT
jgi:N-acyl homoserine lactone hydrolase